MSDTFGSIIDKIAILEKRRQCICDIDIRRELKKQMGWLLLDLAKIILEGYENKRPLTFKKFKIYDKNTSKDRSDLLSLISESRNTNRELWKLEDIRRNKSYADEERLEAADEVATYNKLRNDTIDLIDEVVEDAINSIKEKKHE